MRLPSFTQSPRFWWSGYAAWFVLLTVLSSLSGVPVEGPRIPHLDKVLHFVYFAGGGLALSVALQLTFSRIRKKPWILGITVVAASALVGWLDVWHQSFTPGRQGLDLGDWSADVVGGLAGFALSSLVMGWIPRSRESAPAATVS